MPVKVDEDMRRVNKRNIRADGWLGKLHRLLVPIYTRQKLEAAERVMAGLTPIPYDADWRWSQQFARALRGPVFAMMIDGYQLAMTQLVHLRSKQFRDDESFILANQHTDVDNWLSETGTGLTKTHAGKINQIFKDGGTDSPQKITRTIRAQTGMTQKDAKRVARTTSIWAYNEGEIIAYKREGITIVQWIATEDDLTCDFCRPLDRQYFRVGEPIIEEDQTALTESNQLMHFPQAIYHPPLHPYCRCGMVPIVDPSQVSLVQPTGEKLRFTPGKVRKTDLGKQSGRASGEVSITPTKPPSQQLIEPTAPTPTDVSDIVSSTSELRKKVLFAVDDIPQDLIDAEVVAKKVAKKEAEAVTRQTQVVRQALPEQKVTAESLLKQLQEKSKKAWKEYDQIAHTLSQKVESQKEQALAFLNEKNSLKGKLKLQRIPVKSEKMVQESLDTIGDWIPEGRFTQEQLSSVSHLTLEHTKSLAVHAEYFPSEQHILIKSITNSVKNRSAFSHELGHHLHDKVFDAKDRKAILTWWRERTASEAVKTLPRFVGGILGKKDKFIDAYMGRMYGSKEAEEAVSVAIEWLYKDPIKLARKDPKTFDFVVRLLKGQTI